MRLKRELPPSGNRLPIRDILSCLGSSAPASQEVLRNSLTLLTGHDNAFLYSTGRAAMTALLTSMSAINTDSSRQFVVIPSYTCYSVPASVLKAGLRVLVCDIDPHTLDYDRTQLESLDWSTVLTIVSSNLYGIPNDLAYLEHLAHSNGAFMIDDAAQCLGATAFGRAVGSFGDAGILSFDKGKVVTSVNGGVIITSSSSLADRLTMEYSSVPSPSRVTLLAEIAKLFVYAIFLNPTLYWIPESLPFLRLGQTIYDDEFPTERYIDRLAAVVVPQLDRLEHLNNDRNSIASRYSFGTSEMGTLRNIGVSESAEPIYLRYPVRITNSRLRLNFLKSYRKLGCRASYPTCIVDIPGIEGKIAVHNDTCQAGRAVAGQLVTLPTHQFVTDRDIREICAGLSQLQGIPGQSHQTSVV